MLTVNEENVSQCMLFRATILTLKWDLVLVCVARIALGVATLAQAPVLSFLLAVIEPNNAPFVRKIFSFFTMTAISAFYIVRSHCYLSA